MIILSYHLNDYVDGMWNTFYSRDDILVYPSNIYSVTRGQKLESNIDSSYNQILTDWENTCDGDYGGDYSCDGYCESDYPDCPDCPDYECDIECPEDYTWGSSYYPYANYDAGCDGVESSYGEWICPDCSDYQVDYR